MFRSRVVARVAPYRPPLEFLETRDLLSTYLVDRLTNTGDGSGLAGDLTYCIRQAADGDTITFGVTGTIFGSWEVSRSIRIEGPGADLVTLDGQQHNFTDYGPVVSVDRGATASISGLTLTHGSSQGGGIANDGILTVSDCTIAENFGDEDPSGGHYAGGGGIYNTGALTVTNCTVSANTAYNAGGGIANYGTLTVNNSTISDNTARAQDFGQGQGGGISNDGTLLVTGSTLSDNSARDAGGGIVNGWDNGHATLAISNSTLSGNTGSGGGGIYNGATLTLSNSTIASNDAFAGQNSTATWGGGGILDYGALSMGNTILAGNTARAEGPDLDGRLSSSGDNLIGNTDGGSGFADTDLLNVDPLLGPLQDNGGPTQTMALLSGSPALNGGDPDQLGVPDQRGVLRTGGVNMGAYQASATAFVLSAPDTVPAGMPFDVTVAAVDPFGQPAYGYTGTVTFATTDPDPGVVLPADYTFTPDDQGAHTFSGGFTLVTPGDQVVSATDTSDDTVVGSATVTVTGGGGAPGRHRGPDGVDEFFAALAHGAHNAV